VKVNKLTIKENDPTKPENERQDFKNSLAKQAFQSKKLEKYSNKLLLTNLPENVTMDELKQLFPQNQKIDLKKADDTTKKAIIHYSSAKEAMEMRMSVRPIINNQKFRVIILLLNSEVNRK
jgi:RNA recognition motif-containing protein